jgi:hypothetical protein
MQTVPFPSTDTMKTANAMFVGPLERQHVTHVIPESQISIVKVLWKYISLY